MIESLVVLIITGLILGLGLFVQGSLRTQFHQVYFWQRFRSQFNLLESISKRDHLPSTITFPYQKKVVFSVKGHRSSLIIPKGLLLEKSRSVNIDRSGYIRPETIKWEDIGHHQVIDQIFELGWGVYRLEKKTVGSNSP